MTNASGRARLGARAEVVRAAGVGIGLLIANQYRVECWRRGRRVWDEIIRNTVVNEGLDEWLDKFWKGAAYTASHFVGLTDGAPVTFAAGDTLASHAGWAEVTPYAGSRPGLTMGTVSGQSVDNAASKASYTITGGPSTVGGAFVATVATGTGGLLIGGGAFTGGDKAVDTDDTLNVTVTSTLASA